MAKKTSWTESIIKGHHAYLITGRSGDVLPELEKYLEKDWGIRVKANPDFHFEQFNTLSVDNVRRISTLQANKSFGGEKNIFVLAFDFATKEAQNSFLKTLEDPASGSIFFLIVPRESILLPTLRSRLFLVDAGSVGQKDETEDFAKEFISSEPGERIKMIKDLAADISDEKISKQFVVRVLDNLERDLWFIFKKKTPESLKPAVFEDIALAKKYIGDRSSSVKLLMEHLALVMPVF